MKYERQGLLLPEQTQTQVDSKILPGFEAAHLNAQETFKDLELPPERQAAVKEAWHKGENPSLYAEHLDEEELDVRLESLQAWKQELISRNDIEAELKQAYRWRVNEDIARIHMLVASSRGDIHNFRRYNEFIYGKPDEDIYRAALDWVAHDAERILADSKTSDMAQAAAQDVLTMLEGKRGYREILVPDEETFRAVRDDHMRPKGYYAFLLTGVEIPSEGKINNEVGDPILKAVLTNNLKTDYDIVDAKGASWSVTHSQAAVERPANYNMPWQRFIGLGLGHEIGSHLLEKENGERGPLGLAAKGLDRTELGNEGRATIREQIMYDTFDEFGELVRWRDILRRDIAIGYGNGVGEEDPKPTNEVYAFMNTIDTMYQAKLKSTTSSEEAKEKAMAKTDTLLLRILKGGGGLKDKVYLEGHVATWLTAALHGAERISEGDLGKFDINNPRHIVLLQAYGLLPDNKE